MKTLVCEVPTEIYENITQRARMNYCSKADVVRQMLMRGIQDDKPTT